MIQFLYPQCWAGVDLAFIRAYVEGEGVNFPFALQIHTLARKAEEDLVFGFRSGSQREEKSFKPALLE